MDHLLETAIRLAAKVHKGQTDRFGKPYILHVMRVMMRGHDLEEQILGALHDVLERSELTVEDIAKKGFTPRVIKALQHITRDPQEKLVRNPSLKMTGPLLNNFYRWLVIQNVRCGKTSDAIR